MKKLKMSQYGSVLTGREFGQKLMKEIESTVKFPAVLDFAGVISLGSSFGDEIIPVIAKHQNGKAYVANVNAAVRDCLNQIKEDHGISIEFVLS